MILKDDFFSVSNVDISGQDVKAELVINKDHRIFNGHFPGRPVVPGVCMMQMVKEIIETITGKKSDLIMTYEMKFVAIINPSKNNLISAALKYTIEEGDKINAAATFFKDDLIHFKFKGQFFIQH
jgi:3-hydroxyacyl-[acyl-carrier-protein] dehydratase